MRTKVEDHESFLQLKPFQKKILSEEESVWLNEFDHTSYRERASDILYCGNKLKNAQSKPD